MFREIPLKPSPNFGDGRGCRGRNGWFRPVLATVSLSENGSGPWNKPQDGPHPYVTLEIRSRGGTPITVAIDPGDAVRIADAMRELASSSSILEGKCLGCFRPTATCICVRLDD